MGVGCNGEKLKNDNACNQQQLYYMHYNIATSLTIATNN
jgi:hypothetical protein